MIIQTYRCIEEIARLADECTLCLFLETSITNETMCRASPASSYENTFGLMILSKKELINPRSSPFNNQSSIRGYLAASVCSCSNL